MMTGITDKQAEAARSTFISPNLPAQIRGLYEADLTPGSIQAMLNLAGDLIQELIDLRTATTAPVVGVENLSVGLAEMLYDDQTGTRGKFATSTYRNAWVKRVGAVVDACVNALEAAETERDTLRAQVGRVCAMAEEMCEGKAHTILTMGREPDYPISYFIEELEKVLEQN